MWLTWYSGWFMLIAFVLIIAHLHGFHVFSTTKYVKENFR